MISQGRSSSRCDARYWPASQQSSTQSPLTSQPAKGDNQGAAQQTPESDGRPSRLHAIEPIDGKHGWKVVISGKRPLATPAIADGKLFLGGGFGSHEFYASDLKTGNVVWQYATKDDGPTAAVVADGYVVFNTESCELEVLTLTGKPVWKKWLGIP